MPACESVSAEAILLRICSGPSVKRIRDRSALCDLDIFAVGSVRDMTREIGARSSQFPRQCKVDTSFTLTTEGNWRHKMFTIGMVEICHAFAGKFKMLLLVLPNRHMCCSVEPLARYFPTTPQVIPMDQYISCLQDGIREETQFELAANFLFLDARGLCQIELRLYTAALVYLQYGRRGKGVSWSKGSWKGRFMFIYCRRIANIDVKQPYLPLGHA